MLVLNYFKLFWQGLRHVTGDNAYERYLEEFVLKEQGKILTRKQFFVLLQDKKWGKINRCC